MGFRKPGLTALFLSASLALAGCQAVPKAEPPRTATPLPPIVPKVESAAFSGLSSGPNIGSLGIQSGDAGTALASFLESCPKLVARNDQSGLTNREDWRPACDAARTWPASDALRFFTTYFESARIGDGKAFATGYFEPEILGSRTRRPGYDVPVYRLPPDLVRDWPADMAMSERTGRAPLGRKDASGNHVPYYERAEIERGALAGRNLEIAWAADPIEFFFLQIQGSGLLRLPDGSLMRIGYAGQNGREYVGIGSVMRERGLLGDGPGQYAGSMQGIVQYLRDYPEAGADLMRLNKSWIFFRELTTDGPLGALEVPVRRGSSVAADPAYVPLGAPVWLDLDRDVADGLWIAQEREIAGGMSGRGQALVLLPKGTLARRHGQ